VPTSVGGSGMYTPPPHDNRMCYYHDAADVSLLCAFLITSRYRHGCTLRGTGLLLNCSHPYRTPEVHCCAFWVAKPAASSSLIPKKSS
jgi:hypothetical protein